MSTENATILCNTERWPLVVDAQLQGVKWIRNKYGGELRAIRLGQKRCGPAAGAGGLGALGLHTLEGLDGGGSLPTDPGPCAGSPLSGRGEQSQQERRSLGLLSAPPPPPAAAPGRGRGTLTQARGPPGHLPATRLQAGCFLISRLQWDAFPHHRWSLRSHHVPFWRMGDLGPDTGVKTAGASLPRASRGERLAPRPLAFQCLLAPRAASWGARRGRLWAHVLTQSHVCPQLPGHHRAGHF